MKNNNFHKRDPIEQNLLVEDTWCDFCNEADLGLIDPKEYEKDGKVFISGKCKKCKNLIVSEIVIQDAE